MSLTLEQVSGVVGGQTHIYPTDLTLTAGSLNVLLGPTLSGKTSLMRLMAGLDKPSAGRILWNGEDVTDQPVQKRNIAMVYQQFINYPAMTVYDNIASPLKIRGLDKAAIERRVMEAAELMKLGPMLQRRPMELSGGQQQRCALARALVKDADLVLLDEPLANLDYKLREELREELPRIFTASGAVFVYATTEPTEALLLGGNTAAMWEGKVTQFGETLDVYRRPNDIVTARVFSEPPMNFLSITKSGQQFSFGDGQTNAASGALAGLADGKYTMGFRANHLRLTRPNADAISIKVTVNVVEITGSESFVHLQHADDRWVALVHGIQQPASGTELEVYVDPADVYVFGTDDALVLAPAIAAAA
ncbi:ABC transporter ATP-binding protein [Leucothrix mucor]|jgi:glycerol transport system ATP-binding protein|uniref:ABC transporter ATP-binding protein n=1 Tax=Leucothrix mucor TaxID=45248 RepID=UPI0003B4146B|nr:ABC transporter ATP-binding protein [Leucothrix mucor]